MRCQYIEPVSNSHFKIYDLTSRSWHAQVMQRIAATIVTTSAVRHRTIPNMAIMDKLKNDINLICYLGHTNHNITKVSHHNTQLDSTI